MPWEHAVDRTLDEMPESFVIKPWLEANRAGVKKMLLTEYNESKIMELFREEGRAEGAALLGRLVSSLLRLGRTADIERVTRDEDYRNPLYEAFHLV